VIFGKKNPDKDKQIGIDLGDKLETYIFELVDSHMFFKEIEELDQPQINSLTRYDDGRDLSSYNFKADKMLKPDGSTDLKKLSYRFRVVKNIYDKRTLTNLFSSSQIRDIENIIEGIDKYSDKWITKAREILRLTSNIYNIKSNFIVTSGQLIPTLAKLLLFGLSEFIPIENIYSSSVDGKLKYFVEINSILTEKSFFVIGDGKEEEEVSKKMKFPFFKITNSSDLSKLYRGLTERTLPP